MLCWAEYHDPFALFFTGAAFYGMIGTGAPHQTLMLGEPHAGVKSPMRWHESEAGAAQW
jgi:uncharacterized protein involved in response to NO